MGTVGHAANDTPAPWRRHVPVVLVAVGALVTGVLTAVSDGNPGAALAPLVVGLGLVAMLSLPLRYTLGALFVLVILVHNPGSRPMEGRWQGPLYQLGPLLFENLHQLVGLDALRFNAIELMLVMILALAGLRRFSGDPVDGPPPPRPRVLTRALYISLVAILAWCAYGIARGGDGRMLLWQVRQLAWLPVVALLFARYLHGSQARRFFGLALFTIAGLRALEGAYFYNVVAKTAGMGLEFVTTHDDSVLFGIVLILSLLCSLELGDEGKSWWRRAVTALVIYAIVINGRRLAFVNLAYAIALMLAVLRAPLRRRITRVLLVLAPVLAIYVVGGLVSSSKIFAPVHSLTSVTDEQNSSNQSRDDENYNLAYTLATNPIMGSGFGHPYTEAIKSYDISGAFSMYLYIAHNSVIWLWSLMGLVGVSLAWMFLPITMMLARRSYDRATLAVDRIAALGAMVLTMMYVLQAYGDMGIISWAILAQLAAAIATVSSLTADLEAWPLPARAPAPRRYI